MSQNNPPFAIGQKVVCVNPSGSYQKNKTYTVASLYQCPVCKTWQIGCLELPCDISICSCPCSTHSKTKMKAGLYIHAFASRFAPIQSNYSDATAEILEKFKSPNECPDKVVVPEKVKI